MNKDVKTVAELTRSGHSPEAIALQLGLSASTVTATIKSSLYKIYIEMIEAGVIHVTGN